MSKSKIDNEIDNLAEKMSKSTVDSRQILFDTIMNLGPEGLKKAANSLTPAQQEFLKGCLEEMKKSANQPEETKDAKKLTPERTKTPAKKMETESLSGSDDQDEKLMETENAEHKAQGGPKDSPLEGQIIKGREPGQEHRTPSGAIIIGHTSTGKPMYANAEHPAYKEYDHKDHKDAAQKHSGLAQDIRSKMDQSEKDEKGEPKDKVQHVEMYDQARMHEKNAVEHMNQAAKKEDKMMQKNYGSGMMKSIKKAIKKELKLAKSLFNDESKSIGAIKIEPTKQQVMYEICYKIKDLQDLRNSSWLIESELPEAKELMEKKFSKIKSEIRALIEKHSSLKKAYENFMTKAEEKDQKKLEKKQGVPEGVDPEKWERGVKEVKKKPGIDNPYAVVNAAMAKKGDNMNKSEDSERQEDAAIDKLKEIQAKEKGEMSDAQKLEKKKMKKAKKIEKSLRKIVKLAKSLKMSKEQIVKAIKESNNNLKLVKAEMKAKILKEEEQSKMAGQDKKQAGDVEEKPNKDKGELEIKADQTADEAVNKVPKMEKSIQWTLKSSIAANSLGRNTHYDVDAFIEASDVKVKEQIKKGEYFGETGETLVKSNTEKVDLNDLIAKGMDYSTEEIMRIEGLKNHKADGITVKKSFHDKEIAAAMGMSEAEFKRLMGE